MQVVFLLSIIFTFFMHSPTLGFQTKEKTSSNNGKKKLWAQNPCPRYVAQPECTGAKITPMTTKSMLECNWWGSASGGDRHESRDEEKGEEQALNLCVIS